MIFSEIADLWLNIHILSISEYTATKYRTMYRFHILPFLGDMELTEIDEAALLSLVAHLSKHGNATNGGPLHQNSILRILQVISNIFDLAVNKGLTPRNPVCSIKLKRLPAKQYQTYQPEEISLLISSARPKWLGDMILLAYRTGMRRGEVYGLQWGDIDFNAKSLHIQRSIRAHYPGLVNISINPPKSPKSNRIVMLDDAVLDMLDIRYQKRLSDKWVWYNQNGDLISPCYNCKYFRRACDAAGIKPRRFHDLRHTHITDLVNAGVPLPVIQQRVGHSNITMTMHYTHITPNMQDSAIVYLNNRPISTK